MGDHVAKGMDSNNALKYKLMGKMALESSKGKWEDNFKRDLK